MEVSGQLHVLAALPLNTERWYPLYGRLDAPQSLSDIMVKTAILPCPNTTLVI